MSCCGKEWKSKINDRCAKHPQQLYFYFCTNQNCLQILCRECIKSHRDAHLNATSDLGEPQISGLAEVQSFFVSKAQRQLAYETEKAQPKFIKDIDPCQYLCRSIDEFFYGTIDNKVQNQKIRLEAMKNPTALKLIEIVQKENSYKTSLGFKEQYFALLDSILQETGN